MTNSKIISKTVTIC